MLQCSHHHNVLHCVSVKILFKNLQETLKVVCWKSQLVLFPGPKCEANTNSHFGLPVTFFKIFSEQLHCLSNNTMSYLSLKWNLSVSFLFEHMSPPGFGETLHRLLKLKLEAEAGRWSWTLKRKMEAGSWKLQLEASNSSCRSWS